MTAPKPPTASPPPVASASPPPPPPPPREPRRHLVPIGATALLGFFVLTLVGFCRPSILGVPTLFDRAAASRTTVTHDLVVERVRSVAKLLTSETSVRDVVVYESTWLNSTKRSLVVVTGRVLAGVDLDKGADVAIDDKAKKISVVLPPAEVLAVEVTDLKTYDERAGLWNPFRAEDRDAIQRQVRAQLQRAGTELGVIEHANRSAKTLLETLLATDGYTVDVQTRGVVTQPATR